MSEIIRAIESEQLKKDLPKFNVGDTLRVMVKVVEGERERLQAFEGICIAKRNGSIRETFTLRRVSYGIGVERTFPLHSPRLDKITVLRRGKVRRAKLYYLRNLSGKAAKIKERALCYRPPVFPAVFLFIFVFRRRGRVLRRAALHDIDELSKTDGFWI